MEEGVGEENAKNVGMGEKKVSRGKGLGARCLSVPRDWVPSSLAEAGF
jgi:hypothetical protein